MLLAGDVGGTKVRLALFRLVRDDFVLDTIEHYASHEYDSVGQIIREFTKSHPGKFDCAVIGVPGPVFEGKSQTTNLPWMIEEQELAALLGVNLVKVVNDLYATTSSLPCLAPHQLQVIYAAEASGSVKAVLAPGTGLGQAFWFGTDDGPVIVPSEGGHADFAPANDLEVELLEYLWTRYDHVSYERVLSGAGLVNIYNFLRDTGREKETTRLQQKLAHENPGKVITDCALTGESPICSKVIDIFASVMGAQAGNLVLTAIATGGIYLGGGMPARIAPLLEKTPLKQAYLQKGRLSDIVEKTPLFLIKDDRIALFGAAYLAFRMLERSCPPQ